MKDSYHERVKREMAATARIGRKIIAHRDSESALTTLSLLALLNEAKRCANDAIDLAEEQRANYESTRRRELRAKEIAEEQSDRAERAEAELARVKRP